MHIASIFTYGFLLLVTAPIYAQVPASGTTKANAALTSTSPEKICVSESRKNIDMRNQFGPLRNQGQVGWCYAYAGADILGHWLFKNGYTKDPTSPEGMVSATDVSLQHIYSQSGLAPGRARLSPKWDSLQSHLDRYEQEMQRLQKAGKKLPGGYSSSIEQNVNE